MFYVLNVLYLKRKSKSKKKNWGGRVFFFLRGGGEVPMYHNYVLSLLTAIKRDRTMDDNLMINKISLFVVTIFFI